MSATRRHAHLVGSMPFRNEEAAMSRALDLVGDRLLVALPDGEIGEKSEKFPEGKRQAWVHAIVDECLRDGENWEVIERGERGPSGFPTDYESGPRLRPKHRPADMDRRLDFRWIDYFEHSWPIFRRLRAEHGVPDLRFQVGLPTGLGATVSMMSTITALRYAGAFNRRMAFEANRIQEIGDPSDLLFQVEVPADLAMAYRLPKPVVGLTVRGVIDLVEQVRPDASFGVHLCFGDLNHEALIREGRIDKAVAFANALLRRWPRTHGLRYVHFPLAEAADPPPLDRSFYEPLADLVLPAGVRLVAGFVHEDRDDEEHREILRVVEEVRGEHVEVASSCGLGRRDPGEADRLIRTAAELTEAAVGR